MADASDSKSDAGDCVWVQVPSPAFEKGFYTGWYGTFFVCRNGKYMQPTADDTQYFVPKMFDKILRYMLK